VARQHAHADPSNSIASRGSIASWALLVVASTFLALVTFAQAAPSKQPVDFFGGTGAFGGKFKGANGIAVNQSGAGAGNRGDIYVTDTSNSRIERFARDDHGTPTDGSDDTYSFVSAWGAGVVPSNGPGYEVCTVAEKCSEATPSGIAGGLSNPAGIAVDEDTGDVYVADPGNARVDVYSGDGTFLRAFGFDVVESGPGDAGPGYEVCVPANGDVCKAGEPGSGVGQVGAIQAGFGIDMGIAVSQANGNPASGTVFLADRSNQRIGTYNLDGSSPASIGSASVFAVGSPTSIVVDSRGILYASNHSVGGKFVPGGEIERYDTENADGAGVGFLAPISEATNEVQFLWVSATSGSVNFTYHGETTVDLPVGAPANDSESKTPGVTDSVQEALVALPAIAEGEVRVSGGTESEPYRVEFQTGAADPDVAQITVSEGASSLSGDRPLVGSVGGDGTEQDVDVNASAGEFTLSVRTGAGLGVGPSGSSEVVNTTIHSGSIHVGDEIQCTSGSLPPGTKVTAINSGSITVSQPVKPGGFCGNFNLIEATAGMAWNASASGLQAALVALPGLDTGDVTISGGPGDSTGSAPYRVTFAATFTAAQATMTAANATTPLSGGSGIAASTAAGGVAGLIPNTPTKGLAVDPDSDGAGPDADTLYVQRNTGVQDFIQQFGPANPPGALAPPTAFDALHGSTFGSSSLPGENSSLISAFGLAIDESSGRIYVGAAGEAGTGIYVLDTPIGPGPSATLDSVSGVTATSVTAHATITPNGTPALKYHLEYSSDGTHWESGPTVELGTQSTPQSITEDLSPPGGLEPNTFYHLRLVAKRPFFPAIVSEKTFTTLASLPLVETTGSPVRSSTTARLDGRLSPQGSSTTYHFEYGTEGPCDSNPCIATESHPAGSGGEFELVSQQLEGLEPNTTYHYRLVADNGNPGSPVHGEDMAVSTFANEAPLSHGHFPGPVGSDRAWELVSEPDTSGNPVGRSFAPTAEAISDDGNRAVYGVAGGTPLSETGTFNTRLFAERTPHGWETKKVYPARQQATGVTWETPGGPSDLSALIAENHAGVSTGEFSIWRMSPSGAPVRLFRWPDQSINSVGFLASSDDGSRTIYTLSGTQDPSHPVTNSGASNLYDISSDPPRLVDLLPDGTVPTCGVESSGLGAPDRVAHWISSDGSLTFFPSAGTGSCNTVRLYVRNLLAETTKLISGAPYSGPLCNSYFVKSTADSAYFYTETQLTADDIEPEGCTSGGNGRYGDVYRYDLGNGSLHCVTCLAPGYAAAVRITANDSVGRAIGIAEDGSHLYFVSGRRLLPGAPLSGGTYGLDVGSGKLVYVGASEYVSDRGESTMSRTGSVVVFRSKAARLNAIGGQQNGGTFQDYRFDFADRSLTCVSCPAGGSAPTGGVFGLNGGGIQGGLLEVGQGANRGKSLDANGDDFIFSTPTPLVSADQNTARAGQDPRVGNDIYEWRAGKVLLVSDGITDWPGADEAPQIAGITPSGHDVFFAEAGQLTPDALDGYNRLYDARIGGGFDFPPPPKPCPLEVCQGTPKGTPEEQAPGTQYIQGSGNATEAAKGRCPKQKARRHGRCVAKHHKHTKKSARHRRAKHDRRAAR
jgi:hypothetical protein